MDEIAPRRRWRRRNGVTRTAIFLWLAAASLPAWPAAPAPGPPVEAPRPHAVSRRESMRAAYELLAAGDADAARGAILAAIAANPDDAGRAWPDYAPPAGSVVSDSPELDAALDAMPELEELVGPRPDVREWLSFAFAGFGGEPVVWEADPPPPGAEACSGRNRDGKLFVRVRRAAAVAGRAGRPEPGEVLLSHLVFELFNVRGNTSFAELNEAARLGRISKGAFVSGYVRLEAEAAERARAFFANVLLSDDLPALPVEKRAQTWWLPADDEYWSGLCDPGTADRDSYPWFPYGCYDDLSVGSGLSSRGEYDRALESLGRALAAPRLDAGQRAYAHGLAAYCHEGLGRTAVALEHADAAVRFSPSGDAYERRAGLLDRLGRRREASDDRQRAEIARLREMLVP